MSEERLQKVLAGAGVASRRASEALIEAGRVTVDGRIARIGERVDPAAAEIAVDGQPIVVGRPRLHLAMHKPAGVTSTVRDAHAARTVIDLVPEPLRPQGSRLYPVGRLDRDSEGLLLLTDDGPWADRVLHPRHGVHREYLVGLDRPLEAAAMRQLRAGIDLADGPARALEIGGAPGSTVRSLAQLLDPPPAETLHWYRLVLGEGRKRQARRMFAALGVQVRRLVRTRIGTVSLAGLPSGAVRALTNEEQRELGGAPARAPRRRSGAGYAGTMQPRSGSRPLVVAIDGPASSGKSSVGAAAARAVGYRFCDTGLLYRAVAWAALRAQVDLGDAAALVALVPSVRLEADPDGRLARVLVDGVEVTEAVRSAEVDAVVSVVARIPEVRTSLLERQRAMAASGDIVMAGRDIGSVVLPDADLKVFLDASAEERARRRALERGIDPGGPEAAEILASLRRRDATDRGREVAPLQVPEDAVVIVTDGLDFEATVEAVVRALRDAAGGPA